MEVELISRSGEWLDVLWTAARTCKSEDSPQKLYGRSIEETWNDDDRLKKHIALIVSLVKAGHLSILEHATMTFAVSGVSRSLLAQYSRHRVGVSLSVQSQRYVKMNARDMVLPPSIESNDSAHCAWKLAIGEIEKAYNALVALGVKKEDARFILPNAMKTNFAARLVREAGVRAWRAVGDQRDGESVRRDRRTGRAVDGSDLRAVENGKGRVLAVLKKEQTKNITAQERCRHETSLCYWVSDHS